jgi:hypothetical protein
MSESRSHWTKAVGQRAFFTVDAPEFVVEAVRHSEMDRRHVGLDDLLSAPPPTRSTTRSDLPTRGR